VTLLPCEWCYVNSVAHCSDRTLELCNFSFKTNPVSKYPWITNFKYQFIAGIQFLHTRTNSAVSGVPRGVVWGGSNPPPRNSAVLTKLSRIPSSVENTSVTVQCSYSIFLLSLKIAEFSTLTPQDVWKKAEKF
jgi:hypothetical protein